jgi:hypothetical protein
LLIVSNFPAANGEQESQSPVKCFHLRISLSCEGKMPEWKVRGSSSFIPATAGPLEMSCVSRVTKSVGSIMPYTAACVCGYLYLYTLYISFMVATSRVFWEQFHQKRKEKKKSKQEKFKF